MRSAPSGGRVLQGAAVVRVAGESGGDSGLAGGCPGSCGACLDGGGGGPRAASPPRLLSLRPARALAAPLACSAARGPVSPRLSSERWGSQGLAISSFPPLW